MTLKPIVVLVFNTEFACEGKEISCEENKVNLTGDPEIHSDTSLT